MLKLRCILSLTVALFLGAIFAPWSYANKGDEDKDMFNTLNSRDKAAADAAISGWWKEAEKTRDQRIAWWKEARFGMFIHWGVYSEAGGVWEGKPFGGYAEHLMRLKRIPRAEYLKVAEKFNPEKFNADAWVAMAKDAGMGYFIITAKHHDGFAIYDSKISDFNIISKTPFHRDPIAELSAACQRQGLKFGVYYSHAFDWEHPDAPGNDWEYRNPGGDKGLFGGRNWYDKHPEKIPTAVKYVNEKSIPQIQELLTRYPTDIIWFDTPHKLPFSENLRILQFIRKTKPDVVVNGRLARTENFNFGDYLSTADRPAEFFPVSGDWEAIPTTNESYGYSRNDRSHKPASFFIRLLANAVSRDGNLLLNIGPKGDGTFDASDMVILEKIAAWMKPCGESIHGADPSGLPGQNWGVSTAKPGVIYLHVFALPTSGKLQVGGLSADKIESLTLLQSPEATVTAAATRSGDTILTLPAGVADEADLVVKVNLKDEYVPSEKKAPFFVAPGISLTRLLAFDATLTGNGFKYGDGKRSDYGVSGWTSTTQSMSWTIRVAEESGYDISLVHTRKGTGTAALVIDGKPLSEIDGASATGRETSLGSIKFTPGIHHLELRLTKAGPSPFITVNELKLTPRSN
ncbi:MAG: alpha-L-fucosidase [Puniceicoccales bacterium]|jgi:alpha-L-fucosidase|nr:alpha-L-fucosidase [Puniceicoccales bacterium]